MDTYYTLAAPSKALFTEKRSRFISFAIPVTTREQAREEVKRISKEYFDARHVCWAFMLGADRLDFLSSDNGEPSGTAGKPILGQINSNELTDILKEKGYPIARRTVAKYRQQLNIPVARLRK